MGILSAEMFFWKRPFLHERLGYNQKEAEKVAPIVANAGLYNGFLAVGLAASALSGHFTGMDYVSAKVFFLSCVIVAGIFGAITLSWKTHLIQTIPGAIALYFVW